MVDSNATQAALRAAVLTLAAALVAACSSAPAQAPSSGHLRAEDVRPAPANIPAPVQNTAALAKPKAAPKVETYSVVVRDVRVQELLFALARDAKLNVDLHPGITGTVTLNAIDQTLQQLLTRIGKQADLRWEIDGPNLIVMPDTPYLHHYRVDYVNVSRDSSGSIAATGQITSNAASGSGGSGGSGGGSSGASGSASETRITNTSANHFWTTLEKNIKEILHETDKILPSGSSETVVERLDQQTTTGTGAQAARNASRTGNTPPPSIAGSPNPASLQQQGTTVVRHTTFREAASVIANPGAGVITVRATARQHEKVQEFLDNVMANARRQVLIEATVVEVTLSDEYQQGIDWSALPLGRLGFTITQSAIGNISTPSASLLQLSYNNAASKHGSFSAAIRLLESFGTTKVLSSPKLSVMNNQTAVLKVVTNHVYFTVKADTAAGVAGTQPLLGFTTTPNTVSLGFVMSVTPQISQGDAVMLNIRPSITSKVSDVADPNPSLKNPCGSGVSTCSIGPITSNVPVVRTREMESVIRVDSGNIAVMGGLIEDRIENADTAVPGISKIPLLGNLFTQRNDKKSKTELVIFLRPVVIKDASIEGDFRGFTRQIAGKDFFANNPGPQQPNIGITEGQAQ
jgi:general secretion pathway protein D